MSKMPHTKVQARRSTMVDRSQLDSLTAGEKATDPCNKKKSEKTVERCDKKMKEEMGNQRALQVFIP